MFVRVQKYGAVVHVYIEVMTSARKVAVQNSREIFFAGGLVLAQSGRNYAEGVGNAVAAVVVAQLANRVERGERTVVFAVVERICSGRERLAFLSSAGRCARLFAVNHVARNGEQTQSVFCRAI